MMAYEIPLIPNVSGCVYKLWYYEKYVIVKCKTLARSVMIVKETFARFFKNTPKGRKETDYYHKLFVYVMDNPFNDFSIEIILQSDNPYELLKAEYLSLQAGKADEKCLNQEFDVYIPVFTQVNGKKSWINRGYYLNFMEWKRNYVNRSSIE